MSMAVTSSLRSVVNGIPRLWWKDDTTRNVQCGVLKNPMLQSEIDRKNDPGGAPVKTTSFTCAALLLFVEAAMTDALARSRGPSREQCSRAGMVIVHEANGGYTCCVNFMQVACDLNHGSCVKCDRNRNCETQPADPAKELAFVLSVPARRGNSLLSSLRWQRTWHRQLSTPIDPFRNLFR